MRRLETERFHENGWHEPYESRDSRTELWERGGEIPLRHPTLDFALNKLDHLLLDSITNSCYPVICIRCRNIIKKYIALIYRFFSP